MTGGDRLVLAGGFVALWLWVVAVAVAAWLCGRWLVARGGRRHWHAVWCGGSGWDGWGALRGVAFQWP